MLLQYSKENGLVNPNVINPKRYFYHCQETPPSWLEVLLTLHVYRGVTLFHSGCRSTKETPTWPGDYHKSLQNQHSEKYKFEKLIDLSCVSGFLQHLIFIKDQACWLTHGAIFPFVPFFIDLWLGRLEWTKDCLCRQVPFKPGGYSPIQAV